MNFNGRKQLPKIYDRFAKHIPERQEFLRSFQLLIYMFYDM